MRVNMNREEPGFQPITVTLVLETEHDVDAIRAVAQSANNLAQAVRIVDSLWLSTTGTTDRLHCIKAVRTLGGALNDSLMNLLNTLR